MRLPSASLLSDDVPASIIGCFDADTGELNVEKFIAFSRLQSFLAQERTRAIISHDNQQMENHNDDVDDDMQAPQAKKTRRRKYVMARRVEGGELERIQPTESFWYTYYILEPLLDDERFMKKFRNRFRLPYDKYKELCEECRSSELFARWMGKDATGRDATPIALLVLGSLRYLGRGWTFDDVEEATAVSKEVHRTFFHKFIELGSTTLYERYVVFPTSFEEAKTHMKEFTIAGLPGAMGSTDASHILLWNCEYNLRNNHIGGKSKNTTRKVWLTCCALHNWLLEIDGLDKDWDSVALPVSSDWEGVLGDVETEGLSSNIVELATAENLEPRITYDTSGMGPGDDVANAVEERHPVDLDREDITDCETLDGDVRIVKDLGLGYFRSRLVEHFDILFQQNKIEWPARRGKQPDLNSLY